MATPFPHHYDVGLDWDGEGPAQISAGPRPAITGGAPPEFDGTPGWWSPEHLLLSSLSLCLMTTFQAFARKAGLEVRSYHGDTKAILDKTPRGLGFTGVTLHVEVRVAEADVERAHQLLARAKQHCIVAQALMPPVHLEAQILPG